MITAVLASHMPADPYAVDEYLTLRCVCVCVCVCVCARARARVCVYGVLSFCLPLSVTQTRVLLSKPAGQGTSREGARRAGAQIRRELARVVLVHPLHLPSAVCQTLSPILCRVYIGAYTQAHPQNYNNKNLTQIELDSNTWTPPNLGGVSPYTFPPNSWTLTPSTHTQDSHICIGAPSTDLLAAAALRPPSVQIFVHRRFIHLISCRKPQLSSAGLQLTELACCVQNPRRKARAISHRACLKLGVPIPWPFQPLSSSGAIGHAELAITAQKNRGPHGPVDLELCGGERDETDVDMVRPEYADLPPDAQRPTITPKCKLCRVCKDGM